MPGGGTLSGELPSGRHSFIRVIGEHGKPVALVQSADCAYHLKNRRHPQGPQGSIIIVVGQQWLAAATRSSAGAKTGAL